MSRARTHRIGLFAPPAGAVSAAPFQEDEFSATPAQTVFALSQSFAPGGMSIVTVNGVRYSDGTDYTIVGTTFTWLNTPFVLVAGDCVVVTFEHL